MHTVASILSHREYFGCKGLNYKFRVTNAKERQSKNDTNVANPKIHTVISITGYCIAKKKYFGRPLGPQPQHSALTTEQIRCQSGKLGAVSRPLNSAIHRL